MEKKGKCMVPEGCISQILSLTSPQDACGSCSVSTMFKKAAESDLVWEKMLPSDYKELISESVLQQFSSKKELYCKLFTSHVLLGDETKSMSIHRRTGKKSFVIGSTNLSIAWSENPDHWEWVPHPDSRFARVANLVHVCWLELRCSIETRMLSTKTMYNAYLILKTTDNSYGLDYPPSLSRVEFAEQVASTCYRFVYLESDAGQRPEPRPQQQYLELMPHNFLPTYFPNGQRVTPNDNRFPRTREDGWMEVEIGEFFNDEGDAGAIDISVAETKFLHWKRGLVVEGIELRPKVDGT